MNTFSGSHSFKSDKEYIYSNLNFVASRYQIHRLPDLIEKAKELDVELPNLTNLETLNDEAKAEALQALLLKSGLTDCQILKLSDKWAAEPQ